MNLRQLTSSLLSVVILLSPLQPVAAQVRAVNIQPVEGIGGIGMPVFRPAGASQAQASLSGPLGLQSSLVPSVHPALRPSEAPALTAPKAPSEGADAELGKPSEPATQQGVPVGPPTPISASQAETKPFKPREPSQDYGRMFDLTRRILSRADARKFVKEIFKEELTVTDEDQAKYNLPDKIKEVSESQFMYILQNNPKHWAMLEKYLKDVPDQEGTQTKAVADKRAKWRTAFKELVKKEGLIDHFKKLNDPLEPMHLQLVGDAPAYGNAKLYADHQTAVEGKVSPPSNLKQVLIDFIGGAKGELMFNVFDFDLQDVADAMTLAADRGVKVTGGIYKGNIDTRPEVRAVFDKLSKHKNIKMVAVDSVGLNHQKMVVRDWSDQKLAASLFSSGNFTQSCIGPEGDLKDVKPTPAVSVPNANHMVTMDGYLPAQIAANNMIKTLEFGLRGDEYPLGGAFKVTGPKAEGAKESPYMVMAFSPKGGLGDINRDFLRRLIVGTRGAIRMLQFAFSSQTVLEALVERAKLEVKEGGKFDFMSVGDTPFSLRPWAVFLAMAGKELIEGKDKNEYVDAKDNPLKKAMGEKDYAAMLENIRVSPREYGNNHFELPDGKSVDVNAKLHHKSIISGPFTVFGTSFNFSENAEHNNEQFLLTNDPAIKAAMLAVFDGFFMLGTRSLVAEVERRNGLMKEGKEEKEREDPESRHVEKESSASKKKSGGA